MSSYFFFCQILTPLPRVALGKLVLILLVFLLLGLLPWVDNFAHVAGFTTGLFLSYALMPFITFNNSLESRSRRTVLFAASLTAIFFVFSILLTVFYYIPFKNCSWCKYLTCLPLTKDFCADQNINFKKDTSALILSIIIYITSLKRTKCNKCNAKCK